MNFSAILNQAKAFLARYSMQQKAGMATAAGLVLGLLWLMVYFVNQVEYQVLLTDLEPQAAQAAVSKLQSLQVPYKLSDDGKSIRVPSEKIAELRMQIAGDPALVGGSPGFEIFDSPNFGITNFQEGVLYERALRGELARSILTLSEVAAARVHLVLPKDPLYSGTDDQAKASVIVKLKPGRSLSSSAVQSIINLMAGGVKGLTTDHISVIDDRGKVLSRSEAENSLTGQQLDIRQKMESELAGKIVQLLEPTVGMGKVRPQVSIGMNFQQIEETIEQYDPQNSATKSTQRQQENAPGSSAGGIVTPKPDPPAAAPAAGTPPGPGNSAPLRQNELVNYEVSKSVRHVVNPVGKIEKLSVAVLIDNQTTTTTAPDGKTQTKSTPRTPAELEKYKSLVSAAIAFNMERGDQLTVENLSFDNPVETVVEPTLLEKNIPNILTALRYVIVPVVFLLIYLLFIRPIQKNAFTPVALIEAGSAKALSLPRSGGAQTPMTVRQLESRLDGGGGGGSGSGMLGAGGGDQGDADHDFLPMAGSGKMDVIRKRVIEQAKQDPETVARLVRIWLNEEKNK